MAYIFLIIICLFSAYILPAQQTRKILDKKTGLPVSYATVRILNTTKGTIGSADGKFSIHIEPVDSVLFSCAGYYDTLILGKNIYSNVYMEPRIIELKEVVIGIESSGTIKIGNEKRIVKGDITFLPSPYENVHTEFAQKIILPDSARILKIKKVTIPVKRRNCYGTILFRVYEVDSLHNYPGTEILNKVIDGRSMSVKKNALVIDINSENIFFNRKDSFFISVLWPPGAFHKECRTGILLSKKSISQTYLRLFENNPFEWNIFTTLFKDEKGNRFQVKTFFTVEVDVYK